MKNKLPISPHELNAFAGKICFSTAQRKRLVGSLKLLIKEVNKQKVLHGLVAYPDLVRRHHVRELVIGERWKRQSRQRRRFRLTFPSREQGRPQCEYADYLIKKLGELYIRSSGKRPTRGGTSSTFSKFERFAHPICEALGIGNFRNRVREYITWRKAVPIRLA